VGARDGAPGGLRGVVRGENDVVRAGADPGEIVLRNQTTWENNVNLAQTEYMVGAAAQTTASECGWRASRCPPGVLDENKVARCDFATSQCQSEDNWNTLQPSLPVLQRSVGEHPHAAAAVRVGRQHLRVREERAVFSCVSFLSLACTFSL